MKQKKWWLILAAVAVVIAAAVALNLPSGGTELLDNEAGEAVDDWSASSGQQSQEQPGESEGGVVQIIPDDETPLSSAPVGDRSVPDETRLQYVEEVVALVNQQRAAQGLPALKLDTALEGAAQIRAQECVKVFSHTRPDGTRYRTAIDQAGVVAGYSGENAASGHTTPQQVVDGWMKSEGHRANILSPHYTRIGVGLAANDGSNAYRGYAWVQLFADNG